MDGWISGIYFGISFQKSLEDGGEFPVEGVQTAPRRGDSWFPGAEAGWSTAYRSCLGSTLHCQAGVFVLVNCERVVKMDNKGTSF